MHETNISKVMALLERDGININWQNKAVGNVPFPIRPSCTPNRGLMVSYLYVVGTQKTALHVAVEKDNTTLVALLLGRGAEVYIRDGSGQTAMNLILERQHDEVLNLVASKTISALAETKAQLEQRLDARDLYDDLAGASQLGLLPLPFTCLLGAEGQRRKAHHCHQCLHSAGAGSHRQFSTDSREGAEAKRDTLYRASSARRLGVRNGHRVWPGYARRGHSSSALRAQVRSIWADTGVVQHAGRLYYSLSADDLNARLRGIFTSPVPTSKYQTHFPRYHCSACSARAASGKH